MSTLTDEQRQQWITLFLTGIPYAQASGMAAESIGPGRATLSMPPREAWTGDSVKGHLHPGCATVLADTACGCAVGMALEQMVPFATLDLRMDYLRPAAAGAGLVCEAECYRLTRSVAFVRGEVRQTGSDEPVATVNATFMLSTPGQRRPEGGKAAGPKDNSAAATPPAATGEGLQCAPSLPHGRSPYVDYLALQRWSAPGQADSELFKMPFKPELIGNPVLPALHGGVVAGFAESAAIIHLAYANALANETPPRGIDFSLDYLRPARPVDTWARCTTVRQGARVALVHVNVWQDDPARPIVTARSHCLLPRQD